jgi:hypothetical protein
MKNILQKVQNIFQLVGKWLNSHAFYWHDICYYTYESKQKGGASV